MGRSFDLRATSSRSEERATEVARPLIGIAGSVVFIKQLDDLVGLTEAGFFLRLAGLGTTGLQRGGDALDELVIAVEQMQVLLRISQHEIEAGFDGDGQV